MSQNYTYPPGFATSINPSIGTVGAPVPLSATLVAGKNGSGDLTDLTLDSSGNLNVNVTASALPTGSATAANQVLEINELTQISGQLPATLGQKTSANSLSVVVASDQSAVPVSFSGNVTVVQPTGTNLHAVIDSGTVAATQSGVWSTRTEDGSGNAITSTGGALDVNIASAGSITISGTVTANQGTANATPWNENISEFGGTSVSLGSKVSASSIPVVIASDQTIPVSGSVTVSGTVAATQSGTWNITNVSGTVSLPTGASTSALQTTISGQLPATLGQKVSASSLAVVLASDQSSIPTSAAKGRSSANAPVYNIYSGANITTAAYTQLVASTTSATNYVDIFDSSGQAMILAVGGSGSEVIQGYVPPGGDQIQLAIPAGSRVAYKALTANATSGYLLVNFYT